MGGHFAPDRGALCVTGGAKYPFLRLYQYKGYYEASCYCRYEETFNSFTSNKNAYPEGLNAVKTNFIVNKHHMKYRIQQR